MIELKIIALGMPGPLELGIILAIVVLFFGVKKLPELGSSFGKSLTEFRKGLKESQDHKEDKEENEEGKKKNNL